MTARAVPAPPFSFAFFIGWMPAAAGTAMIDHQAKPGFRRELRRWFSKNRRELPWRKSKNPYRIWIAEVMLQQTQVKTVVPYFQRFVEKYPDVCALARADLQDVLKSWERLGYYARARNLHRAARIVCDEMGGRVPDTYSEFRRLPGVGPYIGAAVQSIAFDRAHPVVDGTVKRVLARLFRVDPPASTPSATRIFEDLATDLLDREYPGDFNQAMMELGATVCRTGGPLCDSCPVARHCLARRHSRQGDYPMKARRRAVPHHRVAVGVVKKGKRILITRRKPSGLLGGLWEFPGGRIRSGESPEQACEREIREEVNLTVEITDHLTRVHHAYSHFRIAVDVFTCRYVAGRVKLNGPDDFRWILVDEIDRYPFPAANHKFIPLLKHED
jgi:A/G-specific adenine glycosylase